jgi:phosphoheptose isomerase
VLAGIEAANARGLTTVALTGRDGGSIGKAAAIHINVAGTSTARVQEVHRTVIHAICALVERAAVKE